MQREQIAQWVLYFYIYCFMGWIWETCYVSVRKKKFVNRGFMKGPLLPIYGSGALCILLVSEPFRGNYLLMALVGMAAATVLEYITGAVMEALFRVRYWDYSDEFLNLNGYVCLKSTLCWGVMTLGAVYGIHPPIAAFVERLRENTVYMLDTVITVLAVADFATSFKAAWDFRGLLIRAEKLREEIRSIQERLEELSHGMAESVQENLQELKERTVEVLQEGREHTAEALQERRERTAEALQERRERTAEALQERRERTAEALQEKKERLQAEAQKLYARRAAIQEGLRSGYYRGAHGLLKRNPGTVWKRNPELLKDIKTIFREHGKEKEESR